MRIDETSTSGLETPQPTGVTPLARARIERAVREILEAFGEDPTREGLRETPRRVASMYAEMFAGLGRDPTELLQVTFDEDHHDLVFLRDVPFHSLCEHHLLPFSGVVHVAYVPSGRVVGVSKLARVVDLLARRPQLQERLTGQIADVIERELAPHGVGVVVAAEHTCMAIRGVRASGARMITSALRGCLREDPVARADFLALAGGQP